MEFVYTGVDKSGIRQRGKLEANSEQEVVAFLRESSITPLSVRKSQASAMLLFNRVKSSHIALFTRQLSSMVLTGLTLIESLRILEKQETNPALKKIIQDLIAQISEGTTFSNALSSHKDAFSDLYISLIRAAEKGGLLDKILERIADNMEKSEDIKRRVKSAMFYPAIVFVGVIVVIGIMNVVVIPQLGTLYDNLNLSLPLSTRIVLGVSRATTTFYPVAIVAGIAFIFLYSRLKKTEAGQRLIDRVKLQIPVLGPISSLSILDEISRTLSLLITSGTSIIESLNVTAQIAGNYYYRNAIASTTAQVERGISLSDALQSQNIFPPILIQMARVGESTGKIDESLNKTSEYFKRDLDIRVRTLTTAIEPILIVVLGVSVAFLILSVITPIYGLISQVQ